MPKSLPVKARKKLLNRVLRQKVPVAQACREFGVSRYTFYKWLKRYQAGRGLKDKQRRVRRFWRQADKKVVEQVRKIALKHPEWSKYQIQKALPKDSKDRPILGIHGAYNILKRLSLSTPEKRLEQKQLVEAQQSRVLSPKERLAMIERVLRSGATIAQVCRELGISRYTFYKWLNRYQRVSPEERLLALANKKRKVERWWRQATPEQEKLVLQVVIESPNLSKYKIAEKLKEITGRPVLSPHGVYNVLRRRNLTLPQARLAYARIMAPPVVQPVTWLDRINLVWEEFIASLAPAPPPEFGRRVRVFAKTLFASTFSTTIFSLAFLFFLRLLAGQPVSTKLGLFFAATSLGIGSVFFAYSMKYYLTLAIVLSFSRQPLEEGGGLAIGINGRLNNNQRNGNGGNWLQRIFGLGNGNGERREVIQAGGLQPSLDHIKLKRYPFVSIHLPFYNEKKVAERILKACTSMDYPHFEIIVCDDSTDETTTIVQKFAEQWNKQINTNNTNKPIIRVIHRPTREGFKGGALGEALKHTDPRTEFVVVFDADFIPYPDTLELFIKYFQANGLDLEKQRFNGGYQWPASAEASAGKHVSSEPKIAAVAGYQWHVLNKSENWITRGVRTEYAGSYVIERPGQEILGAMKLIHGSVYAIRADVLKKFGWGTSITEDFELTLKLYEAGYKVIYTPYVQAPAECVSTLKRLIRQRMRWAEGHSHCVKQMFSRLLKSPHLNLTEKLEFLYLSPYYLQAFFFLIGTFSWLLAETVFRARLPFWTSLWGWSLVLTNFLSLPLINIVGLFLEESEEKDYQGIISFIFLSYLLVPFQAYASVKGFLEKEEGPWFRTPKTGKITDIFTRGRFYRWVTGILPGRKPAVAPSAALAGKPAFLNPYLVLATANNQFGNFKITRRRVRGLVVLTSLLLLLVSSNLSYLATAMPLGNQRQLSAQQFVLGPPIVKEAQAQTGGDIATALYTPRTNPEGFYLENPSNPGVYDTPYIFRQVDTYHYRVFMKSKNGVMRYGFDRDGIHLSEDRGSGFIDLVTGSWFRFQYYQGGTWNDATYNLSTLQMGKTELGDGTITVWIQANFDQAPAAYGRMEMKLGFDGLDYLRKITVRQPDIWSGSLSRRAYWDLQVSQEVANYVKATTDDYQEGGLRPKFLKLGEVLFDWLNITGQDPKIALDKENRTARVWFYEGGLTGNLVIDPTVSTTVSGTYIEVTNARAKMRFYNSSTQRGTMYECFIPASGTTNYCSQNEGESYTNNSIYYVDTSWNDDGTSNVGASYFTQQLVEQTPTRAVIYQRWDMDGDSALTILDGAIQEEWIVIDTYTTLFYWNFTRTSTENMQYQVNYNWDPNFCSAGADTLQWKYEDETTWTNYGTDMSYTLDQWLHLRNYTDGEPYMGVSFYYDPTFLGDSWVNLDCSDWLADLSIANRWWTGTSREDLWLMVLNQSDADSTDLIGRDGDYRNADDLTDGLVTGSGWFDSDENTSSSTDFFNEEEKIYALNASSSQVEFDLDGGTNNRYNPFFKIRAYRTTAEPSSVTVEGVSKSSGTDYNTDLANFSEAWVYDGDGSGYKKLADGGDTGDADEYLHDSTLDFDFGDATYTFGDNATATDYFYLGSHDQFTGVNLDLSTVGAGDAAIQWQYCSANTDVLTDCDTWTNLSVTDTDANAQHLRASGNFYFSDPSWAKATVNSGRSLWWIRGYVSSGSFSTYPVEDTIRTDILLFQYLSNVTANDQTFVIIPEKLWLIFPLLPFFPGVLARLKKKKR